MVIVVAMQVMGGTMAVGELFMELGVMLTVLKKLGGTVMVVVRMALIVKVIMNIMVDGGSVCCGAMVLLAAVV